MLLNMLVFSQVEIPKEGKDAAHDIFEALSKNSYKELVKYRTLDSNVIIEINDKSLNRLRPDRLKNEFNYLSFKIEKQLKNLYSVGVSQGLDWSNCLLKGVDFKQKGNKAELFLLIDNDIKKSLVKIDGIEIYEREWMFGIHTSFQWVGTKTQIAQAKGIIKSVFYSLRTNDYSAIHSGNLLTQNDMYEIMHARQKAIEERKEKKSSSGGVMQSIADARDARKSAAEDPIDPVMLEEAKGHRLRYIKELTQSIQQYFNRGYREKVDWSATKLTGAELDLKLRTKYGLGRCDLKFSFTDGITDYEAIIEDCFLIKDNLRLGFQLKIAKMEPQAFIVSKLMKAFKTERFNEVLESLIPGEDILRELHEGELNEVLPPGIEKNFLTGRVNILDALRSDFYQVIADGDRTNINWEEVKLVDHNYGCQFQKIDADNQLLYLTFDIEYKHVMYIIAIEKCLIRKGNAYVLSDLKFLKLE